MKLSEKLDQVRSQLSSEDLDKGLGALLEEIKGEAISLLDNLSAANSESKNRKIEIKSLKEKLENIEIERDDFKNKLDGFDTSGLENERNNYKDKYHSLLDKEKNAFAIAVGQIKEHPNWDKAKPLLKLPVEKDGKLDWASMSPEDTEYNVSKWNELQQLGYFGEVQVKGGPIGDKGGGYKPAADTNKILEMWKSGDPNWVAEFEKQRKSKANVNSVLTWTGGPSKEGLKQQE